MQTVGEILDKYGARIAKGLQDSIKSKGLTATGQTSKSIQYRIKETGFITSLEILSHLALLVLEKGRSPNRSSGGGGLKSGIETWVDAKPIIPYDPKITKKQLVFLITRKIAREGIKVPNRYNKGNVISDVINDKLIDQIVKEVVQLNIGYFVDTVKKAI
jgi:hypothetical protein